jgi:predicted  nucleic acid-binding Zn-ribbon protein
VDNLTRQQRRDEETELLLQRLRRAESELVRLRAEVLRLEREITNTTVRIADLRRRLRLVDDPRERAWNWRRDS